MPFSRTVVDFKLDLLLQDFMLLAQDLICNMQIYFLEIIQ